MIVPDKSNYSKSDFFDYLIPLVSYPFFFGTTLVVPVQQFREKTAYEFLHISWYMNEGFVCSFVFECVTLGPHARHMHVPSPQPLAHTSFLSHEEISCRYSMG